MKCLSQDSSIRDRAGCELSRSDFNPGILNRLSLKSHFTQTSPQVSKLINTKAKVASLHASVLHARVSKVWVADREFQRLHSMQGGRNLDLGDTKLENEPQLHSMPTVGTSARKLRESQCAPL